MLHVLNPNLWGAKLQQKNEIHKFFAKILHFLSKIFNIIDIL